MNSRKLLNLVRSRRQIRRRAVLRGSAPRPRVAVFRSNRGIYAQLIDDGASQTLAAVSSLSLSAADRKKTKSQQAELIGETLAKKAVELKITSAVFDRRAYRYHGRVKALADGLRRGGVSI